MPLAPLCGGKFFNAFFLRSQECPYALYSVVTIKMTSYFIGPSVKAHQRKWQPSFKNIKPWYVSF